MRRCILLLAAAALAGCGGEDTIEPADRVIGTGTYAYEGWWLHPGTLEWDTVRGALRLDVATPDSVHGFWTLSGFRGDSMAGYWNENAYVVRAISPDNRIRLTNRLSRIGSPSQLNCAVSYWEEVGGALTDTLTTSGECEVLLTP